MKPRILVLVVTVISLLIAGFGVPQVTSHAAGSEVAKVVSTKTASCGARTAPWNPISATVTVKRVTRSDLTKDFYITATAKDFREVRVKSSNGSSWYKYTPSSTLLGRDASQQYTVRAAWQDSFWGRRGCTINTKF